MDRRAEPAPAQTSQREEHTPSRLPRITVEQAAFAALTLVAFVLRFWDVGSRAMHGDESVHAWFAWNLYSGHGYQYDPVYHGPLQFIVTSVFFFLFGVSNTTARLMAVLFGTALVAALYLLRPYVGRVPALIAATFVALSPAFVYVSRLERDDIFTSFFAFVLAISIFAFVRTLRIRWVYIGAASAALSLSAMENTYITLFVFGTFVFIVLMTEVLCSRPAGRRLTHFWHRTGEVDLVQWRVLGVLGLCLLAGFALTVLSGSGIAALLILALSIVLLVNRQTALTMEASGETPFLRALRSVTRQQWLNAFTIVVAILILTFSTFGENLRGIWDAGQPLINSGNACPSNSFILNPCRKDILGGLFYWLSQHKVHRGGQPWFYYPLLYGLYEQIAVFVGLSGVVFSLRRPTLFTSFLVYWGVLMFGIYAWAGEKFSWLMIHPLLPFLILAAIAVSALLQRRSIPLYAGLTALGVLGLVQLHNLYEVNFVNGADPVEMMVYVQSSPDTPKVANDILTLSNKATNGPFMHVTVDAEETWPFAWYLRDMPNISYPSAQQLSGSSFMTNPVILVDDTHLTSVPPSVTRGYTSSHYRLRWWFPEDYKAWTWPTFASRLLDPSSWRAIAQWQLTRKPFGPKDAVWFHYYVKRGLASPY